MTDDIAELERRLAEADAEIGAARDRRARVVLALETARRSGWPPLIVPFSVFKLANESGVGLTLNNRPVAAEVESVVYTAIVDGATNSVQFCSYTTSRLLAATRFVRSLQPERLVAALAGVLSHE